MKSTTILNLRNLPISVYREIRDKQTEMIVECKEKGLPEPTFDDTVTQIVKEWKEMKRVPSFSINVKVAEDAITNNLEDERRKLLNKCK